MKTLTVKDEPLDSKVIEWLETGAEVDLYQQGKLALTHYCVMGNRPEMQLASSDDKTLEFEFDESSGIDPTTETHMNAVTIRFDDADTVTSVCRSMVDGIPMEGEPTTLKRVKEE